MRQLDDFCFLFLGILVGKDVGEFQLILFMLVRRRLTTIMSRLHAICRAWPGDWCYWGNSIDLTHCL